MNKYLVSIAYPNDMKHFESQAHHTSMFRQVGIPYTGYKWHHGQGYRHYWVIKCDGEQLSMLVLSGATVEKDLTKTHKESGLNKLTEDEKEALGLI